jgi:YihY family inner membrane protein
MSAVERLDRYQRSHPWASLPIAVVYKFVDDQGTYLAALITYYGFLAVLPLLLLSSTILNFVLEGNPHLLHQVLDSAVGQFPIVGSQLSDPRGVSGSGVGLAIGILGTIYGGLGVAQAVQNAMNTVWRVPRNRRPNPISSRLRSLVLLGVVGIAAAGTTALTAIGASVDGFGVFTVIVIELGTFAINAVVFTAAFRLATARPITLRETVPGALGAAITWQSLQFAGTVYVRHVVSNATATNSVFALVLGLIAWIYLESFVVVLAAEFNTVRSQHLYPRALLTPFTDDVDLTVADRTVYTDQAQAQRAKGFEQIDVSFEQPEA